VSIPDFVNRAQLEHLLSPTALSYFDQGLEYSVETLPAIDLLTPDRFDLGVKLYFAKACLTQKHYGYYRDLYQAHVAVWNGFFEAAPPKFGAADFISSFTKLCSVAAELDFNNMLIPLDQSGILIDGAHRVSVAAALGREVRVVRSTRAANSYNYQFFKQRAQDNPAVSVASAELLIDQMAFYFALARPSISSICIMPSTLGGFQKEIEAELQNNCRIVYKKSLKLTPHIFDLFILNLYFEDPNGWVGTFADGFRGAHDKANRCYAEGQELTIYFVDDLPRVERVKLKSKIRSFFSLNNDSCHITDTHHEAMSIAGFILNPAWNILAKLNPSARGDNLGKGLQRLVRLVHDTGVSPQDFCIVGSALWALIGSRDSADVDLVLAPHLQEIALPEGVGNHASQQAYYPVSFEEIIYDLQYHFFFLGFKFARPELMLQFKGRRNEIPKDVQDVLSLNAAFPDLNLNAAVDLKNFGSPAVCEHVLERTIREQQAIIKRLEDKAPQWQANMAEGLAAKLTEAQGKIASYERQLASCEEQVIQLERALQIASLVRPTRSEDGEVL
jgi:hypothetical protein